MGKIIIDGPGSKLGPPDGGLVRQLKLMKEFDAHLEAIDAAKAPDADPFLLEQAEDEFHAWVKDLIRAVSESGPEPRSD